MNSGEKTLHLVFDASLPEVPSPAAYTVFCVDPGPDPARGGMTLRQFLSEDYENRGRALCRWWFRQFERRGRDGSTLHRICEWDGTSALWYTNTLFLSPESGFFLDLMVAVRSLDGLAEGTYSEVKIWGDPRGLDAVFRHNGFPCEVVPARPTKEAEGQSDPRLRRIGQGLWRGFLFPWGDRLSRRTSYARGQKDLLLYAALIGEWENGEDPHHRYLGEVVAELAESESFRSAHPLVYGRPPLAGPVGKWEQHLRISLHPKGGVYPMAWGGPWLAQRVWRWARMVVRRGREWIDQTVRSPEGCQWEGYNLGPWVNRIAERGLGEIAGKVYLYEATRRALAHLQPKLLVLKDEVYLHGRLLCAAARSARVKTFAFQHGSIYPTHWSYILDPEAAGIHRPPLPDRFGVYGSKIRETLVEKCGFPEGLIEVVGARRFRSLDRAQPDPDLVRRLPGGRFVVLVAGQLHSDMGRIYDGCFELAERIPEADFVFKPHPREEARLESLPRECATRPNTFYFSGAVSGVLPLVDLVVSGHSTVLLEAIWLGKGGISVQLSGEDPADWQLEAGLLRIVRDFPALEGAVRSNLSGVLFSAEDRQRASAYLEGYLGKSATERGLLGFI